MKPWITVVIPTFNRLELLQKAITSVVTQDVGAVIHVFDNHSSDGTRSWLSENLNRIPGLKITLRDENIGALPNFSDGIRSVETDHFLPLADDDELLPGFLKDCEGILQKHPSAGAIVSQTDVRRAGKREFLSPPAPHLGPMTSRDHMLLWARDGHYYSWSSVVWTKAVTDSVGWTRELDRFGLAGDVWIQFLTFLNCQVVGLNRAGSVFTLHPTQASSTVSLDQLVRYGELNRAMANALSQANVLSSLEQKAFMKDITVRWSEMFFWMAADSSADEQVDLEKLTESYLRDFAPFCGMDPFPLTPLLSKSPLFKKLENQQERSHQRLKHELDSMKASWSWKLTAPMRRGLSLLQKVGRFSNR